MKVIQINAVYGRGSTGTIVRDIEQLCWQSGMECYVACPDTNVRKAKRGYVIGNALDHKIHALLCRIHGKQAYFSHIPTHKLCRHIDYIKPDVVHLHNLHSNYIHLNYLLKHLAMKGIKTVVTLHDCWFFTGGCFHYTSVGCNGWENQCGKCPKKFIDTPAYLGERSTSILQDRIKYLNSIEDLTIVGVSEWISREFSKSRIIAKNVITIHNGVDLSVFKPIELNFKRRLGIEDKFVILGPASKWLSDVNRFVLTDFSRLLKPDEILLLYGCTQTTQDLPKNVFKYGYTIDRVELAQLYTMADVFANVTREDSLSLINVEAQACGTPVVTFDQTGPKETVDNTHSFSVPVGDVKALYRAIEEIRQNHIDNKETTLSLRQFVKENYELKSNYQKYIDLYNSI